MRSKLTTFALPRVVRVAFVAGSLFAVICTIGCRQKPTSAVRIPTHPVHGRLLVDGAPAPGAMVKFHSKQQPGRTPTGIVREDGSFSVSFYDTEDGAPVGEYALFVVWMQTPPQGGLAQDRLGGRFLDPAKPVATVVVREGQNNLEPIELSTGNADLPRPPH
jgi:hypothetical protein